MTPSPQQSKEFWEIYDAYREKMGKVLIPTQLLRWLQTENKMDATIALAATALIPLDR